MLALRQRVGLAQFGAAFLALAGVTLVVLRSNAKLDAVGIVAGLAGAGAMAAGTVMTRKWGRPDGVGDLAFTGWQLTAGGLLLIPIALAGEGLPVIDSVSAVGGYLWLGLVNTALGYVLWFRGLKALSAVQVSLLGTLSPITAAIVGWIFLSQDLTILQLLGITVTLVGIVGGQMVASRRTAQPAPAEPTPAEPTAAAEAA